MESASGKIEAKSGRVAAAWTSAAGEKIADLATALVRANEALGISPDGWTPSARWKREVDIPADVLERADEAILEDSKPR